MWKRTIITCCSLLTAPQALAERLATPSKSNFNEHFSSNVPVSGNVLVGAVYSTANTSNRFYLDTASDMNHFCFKVSSVNGTYVSENDYKIIDSPLKSTEATILEYPTKFEELITNFEIEQLAPLATTGSCDDQRYQHVLLSARDKETKNAEILFMISSGRSEVFMQLKSNSGQRIKANCGRLEEGKRTSYDTICKLPSSSILEETYDVKIARRKNGRSLPATTFTLQKSTYEASN